MPSDAGPGAAAAHGATTNAAVASPPCSAAGRTARRNARRHIAKAIVTTPGIRAVAVENLSLRNMLRSAKGTPEQPGTNVRAKRRTEPLNVARRAV